MSSPEISWMPSVEKPPTDLEQPVERREYDRVCEEMQSMLHLIAHDLNAPLRAVRGFADILSGSLKNSLSEDDAKCLAIIGQSAERAQTRLSGILQVARVESLSDHYSSVGLGTLLDNLKLELEAEMATSRFELHCKNLPEIVGDTRQITELFRELLKNSIQHGRTADKPKIWIDGNVTEGGWIVTLRDNGPGLPEENLKNAFKLFWKLKPNDQTDHAGAGLTVCRRIIDRHCGEIGLSNSRPTGLCVHLRFPNARVGAGAVHRHHTHR